MKQNIKNNDKNQSAYVAPSVKIIMVEATETILATSNPDRYTTEFGDGGDI